jgi:hypothetical protein
MRSFAFLGISLVLACSESSSPPASEPDSGTPSQVCSKLDGGTLTVSAPCAVTLATPACVASPHVPVGTPVDYNSNPPSSGPHFPIWADFRKYDKPVPRGYLVHSLEHGAIVLSYRCDDDAGGCPDIVAGLQQVADAVPRDPRCSDATRVRVIITPDPLLDVKVAAAAWGWTYRADCLDVPSLTSFAKDRYGKGPEDTCANGQDTF